MTISETSSGDRSDTENSAALRVSIVIPAYNEASRITDTLNRIEEFLKRVDYPCEVVVVDDGSQDETAATVLRSSCPGLRLVRNSGNHGKGFSVRNGVLASCGEFVLFTDADLSAPIDELRNLLDIAVRENADVVIGSRAVDRSFIEKHQSRLRETGGELFNLVVRMLLGLRIQDTQCGFKLFRRATTIPVFERLTIPGFGFDPELLFLSARRGLRIVEVPVRWSHAEGSKIRLLRDGSRMIGDLFRIRWNQFTHKYQ